MLGGLFLTPPKNTIRGPRVRIQFLRDGIRIGGAKG